jgi:hypothetical protein
MVDTCSHEVVRSPAEAGHDAQVGQPRPGTRQGVEGFVEPRTAVTDYTLLLVAIDGEWTRRRVPSVEWAHTFANKLGIPSYDAAVVGYPPRMREYNARMKKNGLS